MTPQEFAGLQSRAEEMMRQVLAARGVALPVGVARSLLFEQFARQLELEAQIVSLRKELDVAREGHAALRRENKYHRTLIDSALDTLIAIDLSGRIVDVNTAAEINTGYTREEIIGSNFLFYFTDPEKGRESFQRVLETGEGRDIPVEIHHRNGTVIYAMCNAAVYRDEKGEAIGVLAATRDITRLKKAEEALRESEQTHRLVVESLNEGIWMIDGEHRTTFVNSRLARMFGCEKEEMIGSEIYSHVSPAFRQSAKDLLGKKNKDITLSSELEFQRKDGSRFFANLVARPLIDAKGECIGVIAALQDITDNKRMDKALMKASAEWRKTRR